MCVMKLFNAPNWQFFTDTDLKGTLLSIAKVWQLYKSKTLILLPPLLQLLKQYFILLHFNFLVAFSFQQELPLLTPQEFLVYF